MVMKDGRLSQKDVMWSFLCGVEARSKAGGVYTDGEALWCGSMKVAERRQGSLWIMPCVDPWTAARVDELKKLAARGAERWNVSA